MAAHPETAGNPLGQGYLKTPTRDSTGASGPSVSGANPASAVAYILSRVSHVTFQERQMPRPTVGMHFPLQSLTGSSPAVSKGVKFADSLGTRRVSCCHGGKEQGPGPGSTTPFFPPITTENVGSKVLTVLSHRALCPQHSFSAHMCRCNQQSY